MVLLLQGLWHIAGLIHSGNSERKKVGRELLQKSYNALAKAKEREAQMLAQSQHLFSSLINLASFQCKVRYA
jgi:hypothetical protein